MGTSVSCRSLTPQTSNREARGVSPVTRVLRSVGRLLRHAPASPNPENLDVSVATLPPGTEEPRELPTAREHLYHNYLLLVFKRWSVACMFFNFELFGNVHGCIAISDFEGSNVYSRTTWIIFTLITVAQIAVLVSAYPRCSSLEPLNGNLSRS